MDTPAPSLPNTSRHLGQVAAEVGCGKAKIGRVLYLTELAKAGRDIGAAAIAVKLKVSTVRKYAREFGLRFPDYHPYTAKHIAPSMAKRGVEPIKKREVRL